MAAPAPPTYHEGADAKPVSGGLYDQKRDLEGGDAPLSAPTVAAIRAPVSLGVKKAEAIASTYSKWNRIILYVGIMLLAYVTSLDGLITYTIEATATSSFGVHSLLATVNVIRAVVQAVSQPPIAKIADTWGRLEAYCISLLLYTVGYIVVASSQNVEAYAGGIVIYQFGSTGLLVLAEIVIADTTSLRNRLFWSIVPASPFIINTWASASIIADILANSTWRWGIGMFTILAPAMGAIVIGALVWAQHRAKKMGALADFTSAFRQRGLAGTAVDVFWQLDLVGILLFVAAFALILIPLTLAGSAADTWRQGYIIAMIVIGFLCLPAFAAWEGLVARHPAVPLRLLRHRSVLGGCGVAFFTFMAYFMISNYLYTYLVVAKGESIESASRITSMYSFTSTITCLVTGVVVRYVRYLKPFQFAGALLFILGLGLMIRFRGYDNSTGEIVMTQVILGLGGGLFTYPTQAAVQAATRHEHVATVTAIYLSVFYIGGAIGAAISGAIWTNTLPGKLAQFVPGAATNASLVTEIYGGPFVWITLPGNEVGTPIRNGVVQAYLETMRLITITATCLAVPVLLSILIMKNPKLPDTQSIETAEVDSVHSGDSELKRERSAEPEVTGGRWFRN